MADELNAKSYTSKIKIGGVVYNLKDNEAQSLIAVLNGAKTVDGSVLNSIKLYAQNADYGATTLAEALGTVESKVSTLNSDKTTDGSVAFQVYNNSKDAIYSITPAKTRLATEEDVTAGLATEVGETIVVEPSKVVTIQEAIKNAANSIGNLTINGKSPDENMSVVLNASDINRADGVNTIESTLTQAETDIDAVENRLNILEGDSSVEGSVLKSIKDTASSAVYKVVTGGESVQKTVTIADAIESLENKVSEDTTALRTDINANTTAIETLNGTVETEGSVNHTVYNKAGDATFKFAGAETATTIKAAIQANADAIDAVNNGKITVVDALPKANEECGKTIYLVPKTASVEDGGKGMPEGTPGYIEWVCIADEIQGEHHVWSEIGDTDIDLSDYATMDWVKANAKYAIYKTTEENVEVTVAQALDDLFSKLSEGTATLRADLNAEVERATAAENALSNRVTTTETDLTTLKGGVNVEGSVANTVKISAKDAIYSEAVEAVKHTVTAEETIDESSPYYGQPAGTEVEVTPAKAEQTIAQGIKNVEDTISAEIVRAKAAEKANADAIATNATNIAELQSKVKGTTVKSVNGVAANDSNGGDITVGADIINYSSDVTVKDAIDDLSIRTTSLENSEISLQVNGVDATVTKDNNNNQTASVTIDAKDIKMDKNATVTIFDKINNLVNSNANAITSVGIKNGTGCWSVDADDAEMLNWTDITLETSDATFLVPNAE